MLEASSACPYMCRDEVPASSADSVLDTMPPPPPECCHGLALCLPVQICCRPCVAAQVRPEAPVTPKHLGPPSLILSPFPLASAGCPRRTGGPAEALAGDIPCFPLPSAGG